MRRHLQARHILSTSTRSLCYSSSDISSAMGMAPSQGLLMVFVSSAKPEVLFQNCERTGAWWGLSKEDCKGKMYSRSSASAFCWSSILLVSYRLPPPSLPGSCSMATPSPGLTKRNRFGEEEGGCELVPVLLIDSLEAWIAYFAREKWQLIQPYPLSFCLPAL